MLSPWLIIVVAVCSLIILLVATILIMFAATDTYKSSSYNSDTKIRSAHTYATISACVGSVIFFLLFILIIMIAVKIWYLNIDFKDVKAILSKIIPVTNEERAKLKGESVSMRNLRHSLTILIIIYAVGGIVGCFIIGVFAAVTASYLSNATQSSVISKAYTMSIIAAILGIAASFLSFVLVVFGFLITNEEKKLDEETDNFLNSPSVVSQVSVATPSVAKKTL